MKDKQKNIMPFSNPDARAGRSEDSDTRYGGEAEDKDLRALLKSWQAPSVPASFDARMLEAYRGRRRASPFWKTQPFSVPARSWGMAAAFAVALGVAAFALLHFFEDRGTRIEATGTPLAQKSSLPAEKTPAPIQTTQKEASNPVKTVASSAVRKTLPQRASAKTIPPVEIATDFIPLASYAELASMESGQLVRVLLPRSVLADYGLPVNQNRVETPVTAQVLVGQDGIARAIRFLSDLDTGNVQPEGNSKH